MTSHSYPDDLAAFVGGAWPSEHAAFLPEPAALENLLSTCYQASLLREEERAVAFRMLLASPEDLIDGEGLHSLAFDRPRKLHPDELRRLSPATSFDHAAIGAQFDEEGELRIWGLVQTGDAWTHLNAEDQESESNLPRRPIVLVRGPGHLEVACGTEVVGTLRQGTVTRPAIDVLRAQWFLELFEEQSRAAQQAGVAPAIARAVGQRLIRRTVSLMRARRHGGAILFLDEHDLEDMRTDLTIRYEIAGDGAGRHFESLLGRIRSALSDDEGSSSGWRRLVRGETRSLRIIDDALESFAHLLSTLGGVDGALVLNRRFEVLGFGAFVSGELPDVVRVERAVDLEGVTTKRERVRNVGTRHRAVYRLVHAHPSALGTVVSQDGNVRFVHWVEDRIVCWDQDS